MSDQKIKPKLNDNASPSLWILSHQPVSQQFQNIPSLKSELKRIFPQLSLQQRQQTAQQFLQELRLQGIAPQQLQEQLALATDNAETMTAEELTEVALYSYQFYPNIFQTVLTQPHLMDCLNNPIFSAIVGIMAAKWLHQS